GTSKNSIRSRRRSDWRAPPARLRRDCTAPAKPSEHCWSRWYLAERASSKMARSCAAAYSLYRAPAELAPATIARDDAAGVEAAVQIFSRKCLVAWRPQGKRAAEGVHTLVGGGEGVVGRQHGAGVRVGGAEGYGAGVAQRHLTGPPPSP